jgi:hypothetical protein
MPNRGEDFFAMHHDRSPQNPWDAGLTKHPKQTLEFRLMLMPNDIECSHVLGDNSHIQTDFA